MKANHRLTNRARWILGAMLVATACNTHRSPSAGLGHKLEEMAVTAERDSLLREVAANGKLLGDIQAELAKVQVKPRTGTPESPALEVTTDQRAFVLERVQEVAARLKEAQGRLATTERRAGKLARQVDSLGTEFAAATAAIADQRETLTALTAQVEQLTGENLVLSDSVLHLTDDHNTAFYVVGTRDELLAKGVLVEDGHRDIPLVGTRGVAPARDLPLKEFTSIDRNNTREIPLPHKGRNYRVVSRQNLAYVTSWTGKKGQVQGPIAIAAPEKFWEASRYLIVVEK